MSKNLKKLLEEQLASLDQSNVSVETFNVVETATPVVDSEPIVKTSAPLEIPVVKEENKHQLINWCKTRLNLVLLQNEKVNDEPEFLDVNGKILWMNKPLSTYKIKSENKESIKHLGYLQAMLLPFASSLKDLTKPDGVVSIGTEKEATELYKELAITIIEGISRLLPSGDSERFNIYCDIASEQTSLMTDYVLDFFIVYKTDYSFDTSMLERLQKIESAVKKNALTTSHFNLTLSAVFPLTMTPTDFVPWYTEGYSYEDYLTTYYLPSNATRLDVLGRLPNTKSHAVPHIVLSKTL